MVPDPVHHTLISARKFSDSEYISIYGGDEVNIYYGRTTKIEISDT